MSSHGKFGRRISVFFAGKKIKEGFRIKFRVERFPSNAYSVLRMDIYNMDDRPSQENTEIELRAGYDSNEALLFKGRINTTRKIREGVDNITTLWGHDIKDFDPVVNLTIRKGTNLVDIISDLAFNAGVDIAELGIKEKNVSGGMVLVGSFVRHMNFLATTFSFSWHIFNQELYLYDNDREKGVKIIQVSAATGLLDSPILTGKGVNIKTFLEPSLRPGALYDVQSGGVEYSQSNLETSELVSTGLGVQMVLAVIHTGDTHSNTWFSEVEGVKHIER